MRYKKTKTILDDICQNKGREIEHAKARLPLDKIKERIRKGQYEQRDFKKALKKNGLAIIAEIKKASPLKGVLKKNLDVEKVARMYQAGGASAVSVLTDKPFFQGSLEDLEKVKRATRLPVLRKDFIFDEYQVYEAKAYGADAILLICAILQKEKLQTLYDLAYRLNMHVVLEVHTKQELALALKIGPQIIGINNRDLATFSIDKTTIRKLAGHIPATSCIVAESGIEGPEDVREMREAGAHALLIGSALMGAKRIEKKLNELVKESEGEKTQVKFCGMTRKQDIAYACKLGVDYVGCIVDFKESRRSVSQETFLDLARYAKNMCKGVKVVAVTVDMPRQKLKALINTRVPNIIQLHGNESPQACADIKKYTNVWKVLNIHTLTQKELVQYKEVTNGILLDTGTALEKARGQSGVFTGKRLVEGMKKNGYNPIISGGLNTKNVGAYLKTYSPAIVDVSRGIEDEPGKKNRKKMEAFIKQIRAHNS